MASSNPVFQLLDSRSPTDVYKVILLRHNNTVTKTLGRSWLPSTFPFTGSSMCRPTEVTVTRRSVKVLVSHFNLFTTDFYEGPLSRSSFRRHSVSFGLRIPSLSTTTQWCKKFTVGYFSILSWVTPLIPVPPSSPSTSWTRL